MNSLCSLVPVTWLPGEGRQGQGKAEDSRVSETTNCLGSGGMQPSSGCRFK